MEPTKAASSQGTQTAPTTRAKLTSQSASPDARDVAAGGGFLALLAALGGECVSTVADDSDIQSVDSQPGAVSAVADVSVLVAWQGLWGGASGDGVRNAAGLKDGKTDSIGISKLGGQQAGSTSDEWMSLGQGQGLVAETMMLDTAADMKDSSLAGVTPAGGRFLNRSQGGAGARGGLSGVGETASAQGVAGTLKPQFMGHASVLAAMPQAGTEPTSAASMALTHPGDRAGGPILGSIGGEIGAPSADSAVAAAVAAPGGQTSAGARGEGSLGSSGPWSEGPSGASPVESGSFNDAAVFTDPSTLAAEDQVAEQVAYWVNQKTQNAELTLQRDGQPVEVLVSLSGNEAHVSFRSDQQQTRELLDQSMAQLSDLLRSEGLVLSGMSVGTSARDGAGSGETGQKRPRGGGHQAQVVAAAPVGTGSLLRGGGAADRAVDVFV